MGGLDQPTRVDRRTLIRRAAVAGAVAWTAPIVVESLASPAGALTPAGCSLYVFRLDRNGNSGNAQVTLSADACATTVTGLASTCDGFTRITANGTAPVGTVTFSASYDSGLDAFSFSFSESSPDCAVVGSASTSGTGTSTACAASIALAAASGNPLVMSVPATDVNNVRAWAYVAVSCT